MRKRAETFGWPARLLAVMAVLGVIGLTTFMDSAPVSATHTRWYTEVKLKCDVTEVVEGETFSVELAAQSNQRNSMHAFLSTAAGTAGATDYVAVSRRQVDFNTRRTESYVVHRPEFETREDNLAEGDEKFTIIVSTAGTGIENYSIVGSDRCEITIKDDDPHITAVEVTSSPLVGDTYGAKETIEIFVTYNAEVDVDTYTDNLGLLRREAPAVHREDRLNAETAHPLQRKNLRLPTEARSVPEGVRPIVVGDRPPHRDLSPHRMALG